MSKISEFMNKDVVSISPDDTVEKVLRTFKSKNISGLPVVDSDNKVIGILSARDLIAYSETAQIIPLPYTSDWMYSYTYMIDSVPHKKNAEEFLQTHVSEVMKRKVFTINEQDSWHDAASLMKKREVNRLPVVDKAGRLKGVVTRTDLLHFLAEHDVD